MPALRNAGKNLARLREISAIVARHGFARFLDRTTFFETIGLRRPPEPDAAPRLTTPQRFSRMLSELGPTFVKLGQVLSSRPDILPPDWVRELTALQDRVPPMPPAEVRRVLQEGLGRPLEELFEQVAEEPLASASMAQVHLARTRDGAEVVVKVQRPNISESIRADLDLLYYLASFLERVVEETGIYTPTGIVEEFERSLLQELDFLNEAANVELFWKSHQGRPQVVIPAVHPHLTSRTVLTMDRIRGEKITEFDPKRHDPKVIARNLIQGIFEQVFVDGVFHGDPHPGNLFVLEDNRIGLVDFGLVGRMSKQMQETIILLCLAIALRDPDTVARLLYKIGVPDQRVNLGAFRADIAEILEKYLGLELQEIQSASLIDEIVGLALKYRIKVPKEYAVLTKAAVTIEGIVRRLDPELDIAEVALPYARRLLLDRVSPKSASGSALRLLLQAQGLMSEVPLQLSQILMDLEGGKFVVNLRNPELPQLVGAVRWLGLVVFAGLLSAALIVGSFVVLAFKTNWEWHGIPTLAIVGFVIALGLFSGSVTATMLAGRVHKISLRRFFGRSQ
jgi:ubiquinone biosynthesis protein